MNTEVGQKIKRLNIVLSCTSECTLQQDPDRIANQVQDTYALRMHPRRPQYIRTHDPGMQIYIIHFLIQFKQINIDCITFKKCYIFPEVERIYPRSTVVFVPVAPVRLFHPPDLRHRYQPYPSLAGDAQCVFCACCGQYAVPRPVSDIVSTRLGRYRRVSIEDMLHLINNRVQCCRTVSVLKQ